MNEKEKIPCTVAILTRNSAQTLERALDSVKDFSEIIICDGESTDGTLEIARRYGTRVLVQDTRFTDGSGRIIDFAGVRNQTLAAATEKWFCYIDSDELMTPTLVSELEGLIRTNGSIGNGVAVWVDRKYTIEEKVVDCAATYPTRQMRFFHKGVVTEFIKPIHERINPKPDAVIKKTKNFMLVPISPDPRVWREKWKHYIELEVSRRGGVSFWDWVEVCMENSKISFLYAFRLLRDSIFCSGTKMPVALEWERHVYHWTLCRALWSQIW